MSDVNGNRIIPTTPLMEQWFEEFNRRFFYGKMEKIDLSVCDLGKATFGQFRFPKDEVKVIPADCKICLNSRLLASVEEWQNTLLHEMVHYWVALRYGFATQAHGKEFKKEAARINAISEFEISTYGDEGEYRADGEVFNLELIHPEKLLIVGICQKHWIEDFLDEDTGEVVKIDRLSDSFVFKTEEAYMGDIIYNLRGREWRIDWYNVKACSEVFLKLEISCVTPGITVHGVYDSSIISEGYNELASLEGVYGSMEWETIGTTMVSGDELRGFVPTRQTDYMEDLMAHCGGICYHGARMIINRYAANPNRFMKVFKHDMGIFIKDWYSRNGFTLTIDSRLKSLIALAPKNVWLNPKYSDEILTLVEQDKKLELDEYIRQLILKNCLM